MLKTLFFAFTVLCLFSCKQHTADIQSLDTAPVSDTLQTAVSTISYAQGFTIITHEGYQILEVSKAFPGSEKTYQYALTDNPSILPDSLQVDAIVKTPVQKIIVTSTTHIPSLEMLGVAHTLIGFPNLDYISSQKTRNLIAEGAIKELGQNESLNTEIAIDIQPDVVIGFGVDGQNASLNSIEKANIPVLYNGDWVEKSPLGKAEWIKFFGALYGKSQEADVLFKDIEKGYLDTKNLVKNITERPTVLSGAMYKDVWYLPHGESWPAQLIKDAGGIYLWANTKGSGSIALSMESVLEKGQDAEYWIAPGQYGSYSSLKNAHEVYSKFAAFQHKKIYTFTTKKGETGGLLYYELAPNRPDLVLKDMVFYLHPEVLPDYQPYFFTPFED